MITWVFDVDGVLSNVGVPTAESFKEWFQSWSKNKSYYLISGGKRDRIIYQIGQRIVDNAIAVYCCMGNSRWYKDTEILVNQFELKKEEIDWFYQKIKDSGCPEKTGWHLDVRPGSLNFSIVGRNANIEQRERYKEWDKITNERVNISKEFQKTFPRFESFVGGETSIDICLRGANKGQCVDVIRSERNNSPIYFFGDRCFPGGIDEPFAVKCTDRKSTRLNSSHSQQSRMPSSA